MTRPSQAAPLAGRIALVTGASPAGIGFAVAQRLARAGAAWIPGQGIDSEGGLRRS